MPNPNELARMESDGRSDFEVTSPGVLRRIANKVNELYALNGLDARARDVLMGLIPKQHGGYA